MKLWCKLGFHHLVAIGCDETTVISQHKNAQSIQNYETFSRWQYQCAFCSKTGSKDLNIHRTFHNVLYVNEPMEKVKAESKREQVSKVVSQEIKIKPTPYKEPKP